MMEHMHHSRQIAASRDRLDRAFREAAAQRQDRRHLDPETNEPGWVAFERHVLHGTVNQIRAEQGLEPVDLARIEAVERSAKGHSDYAWKLALRCAELTV